MALPNPEPGLVICYAYLWHEQHEAGKAEGLKDRPSVVLLVVDRDDDGTLVTVLPITHAAPLDPKSAVELPAAVKQHLGLDNARSWIVVSEGNEFLWPGYDLRKIPHTDRYAYGLLPPRFFDQVRTAVLAWHEAKITPRD
jgi:hypothetical protein